MIVNLSIDALIIYTSVITLHAHVSTARGYKSTLIVTYDTAFPTRGDRRAGLLHDQAEIPQENDSRNAPIFFFGLRVPLGDQAYLGRSRSIRMFTYLMLYVSKAY